MPSRRGGPIALITLDRPERRNAINERMITELNTLLDRIESAEELRVIVLCGSDKGFSSGFDLGEDYGGERDLAEWRAVLTRDFEMILRFWESPKPTIAAVHGFALAGGCELAMACDVTIAAEGARFGQPEIRFGGGFIALLLPWFVGPKAAKELMFTGEDRLDSRRAEALGMVNRVVPEGDHLDVALDMARTIASMDPAKVTMLKDAVNRSCNTMGMATAMRAALEIEFQIECLKTSDSLAFQEILRRDGVKAALEWRDNRFRD